MSYLMADMLDLSTLKKDSLISLSSQTEITSMAVVQNRAHEGKKRREYNALTTQLRNVHERISHALHEGGYSPELPDACLDDSKGLTYRPPDFCVETEDTDTEEHQIVKAAFDAFADVSQTRNNLVKSVHEWMKVTSSDLGGPMLRTFERALESRESNATRSENETSDALAHTYDVIQKLKEIGQAIFEEKSEEKRGHAGYQGNKRNADSVSLISDKYQSQLSSSLIRDTKGLVKDVGELCDISESEVELVLGELSCEWKRVCREIWDQLLALHNLKMIKRPTKTKIAKILYLFKLLTMLLEQRDEKIEDLDTQILDMKSELIRVKAKLDHGTSQFKKLRERCTKAQGLVGKISQEREKLRAECDELRVELASCMLKITDLNNLVEELQSQRQALLAASADGDMNFAVENNDDQHSKEKERILSQIMKASEDRIIEMQSMIDDISKERDELEATLEKKEQATNEAVLAHEQTHKAMEQNLNKANKVIEKLRKQLTMMEGDSSDQNMQIKHLKMELNVKRDTIRKLSVLQPEISFSDSDDATHPASIKHQNSQANTSGGSQLSVSGFEKQKDSKSSSEMIPSPPEKEKDNQSSPVNPVIPLRGKSGIPDLEKLTKLIETSDFKVGNEEYIRVIKGWTECDKHCEDLGTNIETLEDKLVKTYQTHKKRMTRHSKEIQIQQVLQDELHKDELVSLCAEAFNLDSTIHWYKNELSSLANDASMTKISTEIKNAYTYNAVVDSDKPEDGIKEFNTSVDGALRKFLKHQQAMIKSLQEGQRKVKIDAEQTVGMEIAHHIKVLAEKSEEVQRYKNMAELIQGELRIVKMEHQRLARTNDVNQYRLEAAIEEKNRAEQLSKKSVTSPDIPVQKDDEYNRELKKKLSLVRNDYKKISSQCDSLQDALARETQLRATVERAAEKFINKVKLEENESTPVKASPKPYSRGKRKVISKSMKRVMILEKLLQLRPTLELSHIGQELIQDIEQSVSRYRTEMERKWLALVRRYVVFKRLNDYRSDIRKKILWQRASGESAENVEELQADYWHIEEKMAQPKRVSWKQVIAKTLLPARRNLDYVFMKVVECLAILTKEQNQLADKIEQANADDAQTPTSVAPRPSSASSAANPLELQNSYASSRSTPEESLRSFEEDGSKEIIASEVKQPDKEKDCIVHAVEKSPPQTLFMKKHVSGDIVSPRVITTNHVQQMKNKPFDFHLSNRAGTFLNNSWIVTDSVQNPSQVSQEYPKMLDLDVNRSLNNARMRLQDSIRKYTGNKYTRGNRPATVAKDVQQCFESEEGSAQYKRKVDILLHKPAPKFWNHPTEWEDNSTNRCTLKASRSLGELQIQALQPSFRFRPAFSRRLKQDLVFKEDEHSSELNVVNVQRHPSLCSSHSETRVALSDIAERSISDDQSSGAYKVEAIRRRNSDVVSLPSISSSAEMIRYHY